MMTKDFIEIVAVILAMIGVVGNNFRSNKRNERVMDMFKENCKIRHNPIENDLKEIKKDLKDLRNYHMKDVD